MLLWIWSPDPGFEIQIRMQGVKNEEKMHFTTFLAIIIKVVFT
jgi:hypothetical protein